MRHGMGGVQRATRRSHTLSAFLGRLAPGRPCQFYHGTGDESELQYASQLPLSKRAQRVSKEGEEPVLPKRGRAMDVVHTG